MARDSFSADVLVHFADDRVRVLRGGRGLELDIARTTQGSLTAECRERLRTELGRFLGSGTKTALCGLPARGVLVRRLRLPHAPRDETRRLVALQIERELPLSPEELSWGYAVFPSASEKENGPRATQDVVVTALRREVVEDYDAVLRECRLEARFFLSGLCASLLSSDRSGRLLVVDAGRSQCEVLSLEDGVPLAARTFGWGGDPAGEGESPGSTPDEESQPLLRWIEESWLALPTGNGAALPRLCITGERHRGALIERAVASRFAGTLTCEMIDPGEGEGRSAVTLGLGRIERLPALALAFELLAAPRTPATEASADRRAVWPWALASLLAAAAVLAVRFGVPEIRRPELEAKVAATQTLLTSLPVIDSELRFLDDLERTQAPFLDALAAIAKAAPPGTFLTELSMSRQGLVSLQGSTGSFEHANELRAKLAASGWFQRLVLEEQTPTKDRKRVELRLSGELRQRTAPQPASGAR
jgi:Tfp pilus assembly protein PilN